MARWLSPFLIGLIFGAGIALSGMINPAKVLNFFDVAGTWDPSLAFVMGGALTVAFFGYRFVLKRPGPVFGGAFQLPTRKDLDKPLVLGSAIFGLGWGLAGFCPGASIPALGLMRPDAFVFVAAMIGGMLIARAIRRSLDARSAPQKA